MDIESSERSSDNNRDLAAMDQQSPVQKIDLFERMLNLSISEKGEYREYQIQSERRHHRKTDFRKILNSSSSNQKLFPVQLKRDSSLENSERLHNFYETQNSMDEESFRKSFKKREQSFSISHTIRDSSSSISERSDSKSFANILPPEYREEQIIQVEQKKFHCNCKRSKCLKLYCECFQRRLFCNENCNCHDCGNKMQNQQKHRKAIISALGRNAYGFDHDRPERIEKQREKQRQRFSLGVELKEVKKGCKCKRTNCTKKYCECVQNGLACGIFCRCENCQNTPFPQKKKMMP